MHAKGPLQQGSGRCHHQFEPTPGLPQTWDQQKEQLPILPSHSRRCMGNGNRDWWTHVKARCNADEGLKTNKDFFGSNIMISGKYSCSFPQSKSDHTTHVCFPALEFHTTMHVCMHYIFWCPSKQFIYESKFYWAPASWVEDCCSDSTRLFLLDSLSEYSTK